MCEFLNGFVLAANVWNLLEGQAVLVLPEFTKDALQGAFVSVGSLHPRWSLQGAMYLLLGDGHSAVILGRRLVRAQRQGR